MNKGIALGLGIALLVAVGCSSSSAGSSNTHLSEQENGACPTAPTIVTGSGTSGSSCSSATNCAPICCSCASGTGQWAAAECLDNKCDNTNACADTAQLSFCK